MLLDPDQTRTMDGALHRVRNRRPWLPLLSALLDLTRGQGELVSHSERPWASVTFSGTRHKLTFAFNGFDAVAAGEDFIACLPEHEFAIPGQLVADAAIVRVEHNTIPAPRLTIEAELLLLDER
jgi:hypothetical protein